jgi:FkbM family methyltransferase
MRFVSYAQNFEDVMLWRALRHVRGGFYIDVGANDPVKDSVTKAFSDRGWHGINVEPVAAHHADLERERPLDVNLRCALGASDDGTIDLWECEIPGLATTDAAVVEQHVREGRQGAWQRVPVQTLAAVCAEHAGGGEIHFLKIDVEGGEESVLAGADFRRFRPWIVVVEATRPNSTEQKHEQWEHLLTDAAYRFAYADGLNRFYVAQEHDELRGALVYPPNIFDGFVVAQQFNLEQESVRLKGTVHELDTRLRDVSAQVDARVRDATERADARVRAVSEQAEARVRAVSEQAEARVRDASERASKAGESAALANERALQFSDRATQAETRTQDYVARTARAEAEARFAQEHAAQLADMAQATQRLLALRDTQLEQARLTIQQVYASSSWRVTRPLRRLGAWWKGEPVAPSPAAGASGHGRTAAPDHQPEADQGQGSGAAGADVAQADVVEHLPARARRVYEDIKNAAAKEKH